MSESSTRVVQTVLLPVQSVHRRPSLRAHKEMDDLDDLDDSIEGGLCVWGYVCAWFIIARVYAHMRGTPSLRVVQVVHPSNVVTNEPLYP